MFLYFTLKIWRVAIRLVKSYLHFLADPSRHLQNRGNMIMNTFHSRKFSENDVIQVFTRQINKKLNLHHEHWGGTVDSFVNRLASVVERLPAVWPYPYDWQRRHIGLLSDRQRNDPEPAEHERVVPRLWSSRTAPQESSWIRRASWSSHRRWKAISMGLKKKQNWKQLK